MAAAHSGGVEWGGQENGPAPLERPGPDTGGDSSDATASLLSPDALAYAARVREAERNAVKNKSYRATPVGGEIGRFLRALRWSDKSQNTLDTYEIVLSRLAIDFAHYEHIDQFDTDTLRGFLDDHWGDASAATRANRLAAVRSFFNWAVDD